MDVTTSPFYAMVHDLYALPRLFGLAGRRERADFLYRSTESGVPLLYRWAAGTRQLLTPGEEPVMGFAALHPTRPWVILAQDQGGSENHDVVRLDYERGERATITRAPVGRIGWIGWLADDEWLVLGGDQEEQYVRRLAADGSMQPLFSTPRWIRGCDVDPASGRLVLAVGRGEARTNYDIAVIDVAGGAVERWLAEGEDTEDSGVAVHAGRLAYHTNADPARMQIVIRDLATGHELRRFAAPGDVEHLDWLDTRTMAAVIGRHGALLPRLLDVETGAWSPPLGDGSTWSLAVTASGPIWNGSTLARPGAISRHHGGAVEDLIAVPNAGNLVAPEEHWFESFDGRRVQGWLLRQPDPAAPLVIYAHGGPTSVTANMWRANLQALAQAGFHVFAPNFRGSTTFGTTWRDLNIGDLGGGDLQDVLHGARYARALLGQERLPAITGGSYGGFLTLYALTTQPDEWLGGVALVPVADWVEDYYLLDAGFRFFDEFFFGGTPEEKPELYRERSPITHLERLRAPVLILHGENDSRCAIEPVIRFTELARQQGKPVEMVITRDEGHGSVVNSNAIRDTVLTLEHLATLFG